MKHEPWPTPLQPGITVAQAEKMWPRDPSFRPDKLTLVRQARGLSMAQLAVLSGVSARRISRLERNLTTPKPDEKQRLADALDVRVTFFAKDDVVVGPPWWERSR